MSADLAAFDDVIDGVVADVDAAVRPAAQAAAQVLYDCVKLNVAGLGRKTGNLAAAIYQVYSKAQSGDGKATYHVSWNAKKAPHGRLVEFGHIQTRKVYMGSDGKWYTSKTPLPGGPKQIAAHPFIRPAVAKFPEAIEAANAEFYRRLA
jgi:HK97 gp10 family phage protein